MPRHIQMLVRALSVNGRTFQISANMEKYFKGNLCMEKFIRRGTIDLLVLSLSSGLFWGVGGMAK